MRNPTSRLLSSINESAGMSEPGVFDYDREEALSIGLDSVAAIAQVVNQRHGGSTNIFSIASIVVSLFFYFASKYLSSRTCVSAARRCRRAALFSANLAIGSLLAMALRGKFKCIPYSLCFFPLVSLLLDLFPSLKCSENPRVFFIGIVHRKKKKKSRKCVVHLQILLPFSTQTSHASMQMAVRPPTVMHVGDANAEIAEAEEEASGEYNCFFS